MIMRSPQHQIHIKLKRFRWISSLLLCLFALRLPSQVSAQDIMQEVVDAVHQHHYKRPPKEALFSVPVDSINEFLKTLDPHSKYLTADAYRKTKQNENEGCSGIGVEVTRNKHGIVLVPFCDGPAYQSGIRERQYLVAINGHKTEGMDIDEVGNLLAGLQGSTIRLRVSSHHGGESRDVKVFRGEFTPSSVEVISESNIEYIRIRRFISRRTLPGLTVAIRRMKEKGLRIILDLRDSTGGDLYEALDAASLFLPGGRYIGKVMDGSGNERHFYSLPNQQLVFDRILVLVGPHTASAAELFLASLRHYSRVISVGQRTYGKCTSQKYIELSDGSALKLTNLKIVFPSGEFCNGVGLEPDIPVTDDDLFQTKELISKGIKGFH